jgi:KDO2-lipid IV(A) lauroyltransferase
MIEARGMALSLQAKPGADANPSGPRSEVLAASLPAHWGLWQRLKNGLIYLFVRVSLAALARVPYVMVEWLALGLGRLAPLCAPAEARRARKHLALAFPELGPAERRRLARRMFLHLGRAAAEVTHIERFLDGPQAVRLSPEQRLLLDAAFAEGRGVVAVTGHIGNWELLAQVVARAGYPIVAIAKPAYDPRLTRLIHAWRTRFGMQVIWRGDTGSSKEILAVFKRRAMLALLVDQDTKVQGAFVPFFGRPAYTPTAAASLALRFGSPVLVVWHQRRGGGHELHLDRLELEPSSDRDEDVIRLTALVTARLEAAIRQAPEQWVWMHRRWHRQPEVSC